MYRLTKEKLEELIEPQNRLKMARENYIRPAIYPGDIVKIKKHKDSPRDDRLFVVLKIGHRRGYWVPMNDDPGSYDGEDILRIKEYKKNNAKVRLCMRKRVWFTGKRLSL